jgi:cutinase
MKYSHVFYTLTAMAAAAPFEVIKPRVVGTTANDLLDDTTCRANYLIIARASTEADNIVSLSTKCYSF